MAKGVPGSGHTQYHINQVRKDTNMASKYTAAGKSNKSSKGHGKKGGSC